MLVHLNNQWDSLACCLHIKVSMQLDLMSNYFVSVMEAAEGLQRANGFYTQLPNFCLKNNSTL